MAYASALQKQSQVNAGRLLASQDRLALLGAENLLHDMLLGQEMKAAMMGDAACLPYALMQAALISSQPGPPCMNNDESASNAG